MYHLELNAFTTKGIWTLHNFTFQNLVLLGPLKLKYKQNSFSNCWEDFLFYSGAHCLGLVGTAVTHSILQSKRGPRNRDVALVGALELRQRILLQFRTLDEPCQKWRRQLVGRQRD